MEDTDFDTIRSQLQRSPDAVPWARRREIARIVATAMEEGDRSDCVIHLTHQLAVDSKWEVRADVAELLVLLPGEHFTRVAAVLSDDANSFVRRAAQRALDRRRRGQEATRRDRQEFNSVQSQYAAMEKLYGKAVAEKARRAAERLFDNMMAATVHEMRGILTPLMASTSTLLHRLEDGQLDADEFHRHLSKTASRLEFLERLVEDMRTYSQPPPERRSRERLLDLVRSAESMVRENLEAQGRQVEPIIVDVDVSDTLVVEVSRHLMLVALGNVLKNAFDALADGLSGLRPGAIAISARLIADDAVEIVVQDNGMGICPEDLHEIMDFVPGRTTKKNQGTGFGLPIAQRNLAAHGGSIGIRSEVNAGTTVTIVIPIEHDAGGNNGNGI